MKISKTLLLASFACSPLLATAAETAPAKNPVSVHVLNLQTGVPTAGITVELEQHQKAGWVNLASGVTDQNGRINALFPADKSLTPGDYKVTFKTGDYYQQEKQPTFFPEIPVMFHVDKSGEHLHIPLLLSPFGYSTYRGN